MQQLTETSFLRLREVKKRTGLPTSTLYLRMQQGTFPKSHKIGYRSVAWLLSDVESWISQKTSKTAPQ